MRKSQKKKYRKQRDELLQTTREKLEQEKVKKRITWFFQITVTLVLAALVAIFVFQPVVMQESAMEPTMNAGDRYFESSLLYTFRSPKRGDIVMFKIDSGERSSLHIRRIIGLPGDVIQIKEGQILINGSPYTEPQGFDRIESGGLATNPLTIGRNQYFVLGDNRNNSEDSRYNDVGLIHKKNIVGKLWFQYAPKSKMGFLKNK